MQKYSCICTRHTLNAQLPFQKFEEFLLVMSSIEKYAEKRKRNAKQDY